ncbi:MAG: TetR/AcrR family transcriptional regulator C-terminal ligand-binding domain-containing protein [Ilumatobacteraceae bacterium]
MSAVDEKTVGSTGRRERTRRATDAKIVAAVVELVRRSGPAAVTMEAVSDLSGVAKTTLYRRYDDRFEMLTAVATEVASAEPGTFEWTQAGFAALARSVQQALAAAGGFTALGVLLASDDEFITVWRERLVSPRLDAISAYFAGGVAAGVLRDGVDHRLVIELLIGGAAIGEALRGGLPDDWADSVAALLWPQICAAPAPAPKAVSS